MDHEGWIRRKDSRPKANYFLDDGNNNKKAEGTKKCVIKRILQFNDYKDWLFKNEMKWY